MQTIREARQLPAALIALRAGGKSLALVPTMGALHAGHMALVEEARRRADRVAATIFVNPLQFGANEDLDRYPRQEEKDAQMLAEAGCDLLWMPDAEDIYPPGFATTVRVAGLSDNLCGASRPGHFDGVATVVAKLFAQVRPDLALFGEKDWQQLAVIRRMARDLDLSQPFAERIMGAPTVREADGLALSSRNVRLDADERRRALAMPGALNAAIQAYAQGDDPVSAARRVLAGSGLAIDYVSVATLRGEPTLVIAARSGRTRLIDNVPLNHPALAGLVHHPGERRE